MKLNIALPGLIWPDLGDLEYIYSNLVIDNISQLLKRGTISYLPFGYSDLIYESTFSVVKQNFAMQMAQQLQVANKYTTFLIAEPTHLRVDRDRLLISESEILQLNSEEADTIINAINLHFNQEISLYYIKPNLWLIGLNYNLSDNKFYPILDIIGENIDEYLPHGTNSIHISRILNEIQMLLFNLGLNQTREANGLLTINSLWLWNKKNCANIKTHFNNIIMGVNDLDIKNLNHLADNDLIIIDKLYYASRYRDSHSWRNNLELVDEIIAKPLLNLYHSKKLNDITILIPENNQTLKLSINRFSRYKFWQKHNLINLSRR